SSRPFLVEPSRVLAFSLFTWDSAMSALSSASSSSCCSLRSLAMLAFPASSASSLLLATLHGHLLSLIQPMLKVFDGLLHVFFHALQVGTGVLLLLQFLSHHGSIIDGLIAHALVVPLGLLHLFIFF
uniref:Uncharacterized protein n=1 Tax=Takifugu rubripes TaxID=31033 RepID=A0A674N200_TAKRU